MSSSANDVPRPPAQEHGRPESAGFALYGFALALFVAGSWTAQPFLSWTALAAGLPGLGLLLAGPRSLRLSLPAAVLALLLVPMPVPLNLGGVYPLKAWTAACAAKTLSVLGIPASCESWTIGLPSGPLHVVDACSGARTQLALVVVATLLLCLRPEPRAVKLAMLASCLPIGFLAGVLRVAAVGAAHVLYHGDGRFETFHGGAGLLVIVPGVLGVLAVGRTARFVTELRLARA